MKTWVRIILIMTGMLLVSGGCSQSKKEIAVLIYDMEDPFIKGVAESLEIYNELGYVITYYDSQNSQVVQNEIAKELYDKGIDLLVINPVDRLSSYIFVRKSAEKNVPIIFFNREPLKEDLEGLKQVYYVGAEAKESGVMQAQLISEAFDHDKKNLNGFDKNGDHIIQCVIFKGEQGHQDAEERTTAVIESLEAEGYGVEVLVTKVANWNEEKAYRAMDEIMSEYGGEIELLISNNDGMAIGATKYLMENGYFGEEENGIVTKVPFPIVGIDGLEEAILFTKKGYMYGTIINDGDGTAEAIMALSEFILEDKEEILTYELIDGRYILIPYKHHSND